MNPHSHEPVSTAPAPADTRPHESRPWLLLACVTLTVLLTACGGDIPGQLNSTGSPSDGGDDLGPNDGGGGSGAMDVTSAGGGTGGAPGSGGDGGDGGFQIPWAEPPLHLEEHCVGEVALDEIFTFNIPDNTIGFTVLGTTPDENDVVYVDLLGPGEVDTVVEFAHITGNRVDTLVNWGSVAAANPLSDSPAAWPMHIGRWRASFGDNGPGAPADVCIVARRSSDGMAHGGVMDVNVLMAPGAGVDADYVMSTLDDMFSTIFEPTIGVSKGTVTFGTVAAKYDSLGTQAQVANLFRTSDPNWPRPAVNLFVVGGFVGPDLEGAGGVAGGAPGSPTLHGTAMSGVAFAPSGDTTFDATVLAHEFGHLGGLAHTSEILQGVDSLSDTPECANVQTGWQDCPDLSNMMFPFGTGSTQISAAQARVLEGSALYRGSLTANGSAQPPMGGASTSSTQQGSRALIGSGAPIRRAQRIVSTDPIERLLSSHWCGHDDPDHMAVVWHQATPAQLLRIASDERAFDLARGRAVRMLHRFATDDRNITQLVAISSHVAASSGSGRSVALAAVGVLAEHDPEALSRNAPALRAHNDALVVARLDRLELR